jgi:hypothetical protein
MTAEEPVDEVCFVYSLHFSLFLFFFCFSHFTRLMVRMLLNKTHNRAATERLILRNGEA